MFEGSYETFQSRWLACFTNRYGVGYCTFEILLFNYNIYFHTTKVQILVLKYRPLDMTMQSAVTERDLVHT